MSAAILTPGFVFTSQVFSERGFGMRRICGSGVKGTGFFMIEVLAVLLRLAIVSLGCLVVLWAMVYTGQRRKLK